MLTNKTVVPMLLFIGQGTKILEVKKVEGDSPTMACSVPLKIEKDSRAGSGREGGGEGCKCVHQKGQMNKLPTSNRLIKFSGWLLPFPYLFYTSGTRKLFLKIIIHCSLNYIV